MEPEVKEFLLKIVKSLSIAVLWMMTNMTLGIFFNFGFIDSTITVFNIVFYVFFLSTLVALVWYLLKLWKENLQA